MKITIKILAEDIRTSDYTEPKDCAIARAIKRVLPEDTKVGVDAIAIINKLLNDLIFTPPELENKVYDMYRKYHFGEEIPQDFEYELDIPDHWLK